MGSRHGRTTDSARPSPERAKQTQPWRARCRVSSSRRRNKVCHARAMRGRAVRPVRTCCKHAPKLAPPGTAAGAGVPSGIVLFRARPPQAAVRRRWGRSSRDFALVHTQDGTSWIRTSMERSGSTSPCPDGSWAWRSKTCVNHRPAAWPSLFERTSRARPRFPRARVRLRSPA